MAFCGRADSTLISLFSGTGPAHPPLFPQLLVSVDPYRWGPIIAYVRGGLLPCRRFKARKSIWVSSPGAFLSHLFFRARILGGVGWGVFKMVTSMRGTVGQVLRR